AIESPYWIRLSPGPATYALATSRRFGINIQARTSVERYRCEPVGLPVVSYVGSPVWRLSGAPAIMKSVSDPRQSDMEPTGGTAHVRCLGAAYGQRARARIHRRVPLATGGMPRPGRRVHLSAGSRRASSTAPAEPRRRVGDRAGRRAMLPAPRRGGPAPAHVAS